MKLTIKVLPGGYVVEHAQYDLDNDTMHNDSRVLASKGALYKFLKATIPDVNKETTDDQVEGS